MCPVCLTTAVLIAGGVATGGLAAVAMKRSGVKTASDSPSTPTQSKEDHPSTL
jgi:hypothetical protein